jgi:tetratricopeptide (TPR) repeat protein
MSTQIDRLARLDWQDLHDARTALWLEENPRKALELLPLNPLKEDLSTLPVGMRNLVLDLAITAHIELKQLENASFLLQTHKRWEQLVLLQIAMRRMEQASQTLKNLPTKSASYWAEHLLAISKNQLMHWPTFLQLRNRLESDIRTFFSLNAFDAIDQLVGYLNSFSQLNPEVFKLVGRCFVYCGLYPQAYHLLQHSCKLNPVDAESYFHLGELYLRTAQKEKSRLMLTQALMMNPACEPAKVLLSQI